MAGSTVCQQAWAEVLRRAHAITAVQQYTSSWRERAHLSELALAAAVHVVHITTLRSECTHTRHCHMSVDSPGQCATGGPCRAPAFVPGGNGSFAAVSLLHLDSGLHCACRAALPLPAQLLMPLHPHLGGQPDLAVGGVAHVLQPPRGGAVVGLPVRLACGGGSSGGPRRREGERGAQVHTKRCRCETPP